MWPPEQPQDFTPVVLLFYNEGKRRIKDTTIALHTGGKTDIISATSDQPVPKVLRLDNFQEALQASKVTRNIADILVCLEQCDNPQTILIEGAPGIGKSMLMKHIAYCWAEEEALVKFQFVLLVCLRDPGIQKMTSTTELLQSFCKFSMDASKLAACNEALFQSNGKSLVFLLDGYDEFPAELRQNSLIASIINRQVLPKCGLVVSSRPYAALHLHNKATLRVDILGFTEKEQEHFIEQSLAKQPQKISELTSYLHQNVTIRSLCFTPSSSVLLFLYEQGFPLPNNYTEVCKHFIILTISRHLTKYFSTSTITCNSTDLRRLPDPCDEIIQQLQCFPYKL